MKNLIWVILSGCLCASSVRAAGILAGPVYNPATTHSYFLLTSSSWTEAEAAAISLGGHLVTVNDSAENDWLVSTFSNFGGQPRALWTGLTDAGDEGSFLWSSGEESSYTNWEMGQPDDGAGIYPHEDYVMIWPSAGPRNPGFWNDYIDTNTFTQFGFQLYGVVEVPTANNWTNPSSGKWESSSWSLGTLPAYDQTVNIANDGYKAVNIDNTTLASFPDSVTVGSLGISAPTNGLSTLLLNYFGQSTPLKVINSCFIGTNGTLLNLGSSFQVDAGGVLTLDGGTFIQEGGLTVVTPSVQVLNGSLNATNATMNLGPLQVGGEYPDYGIVYQSGGTILSSAIGIDRGRYLLVTNGTLYSLYGTYLTNAEASFVQTGGSNYGDVHVVQGNYDLEDGLVQALNLSTFTLGRFAQNGGIVQVQNPWAGGLGTNFSPWASYNLNSGTLYCATFNFSHYGFVLQSGGTLVFSNRFDLFDPSGFGARFEIDGGNVFMPSLAVTNTGDYLQRGGTNQVAGDVSVYNGAFAIYGGRVSAANLGVGDGARIYQQGGATEVSQVLSITGTYALEDGTLSVNGIYLRGTLAINSLGGSSPVLNNSGLINFGGTLALSASQNSLGQLGLSTNGTISFGSSSVVVRFADSSALNWDANSRLVIEGWNGSSAGNGTTQVYFGNNSAGLTAAQLSQIYFSIGSTNYSAKILGTGEVVPNTVTSITPGVVNSWTNPGSGNWDQATNWSQGVLPDSSQSVFITNSGWKAVAINPATPTSSPGSMTVSNLTIRGATNTQNVLLLNSFGTDVPLTVSNGLTLQDDGRLLNFNSGLVVQHGTVLVTNSQMIQDGGLAVMTNAQMYLSQAEYDITNGVFEGGLVLLGAPFFSTFNQYGGMVTITNLILGPGNANGPHGGAYALYGGNLNLPGGLSLEGYPNNATSYLQEGGTNQTTRVYVSPESSSSFKLNGGLLADNNVSVISDNFGTAAIVQNGGAHVIANTLTIEGGAANGFTVLPATYSLNGGTLSAGVIELAADQGDSVFVQSNATTFAGTIYAHSLGYYGSHNTSITLAGGTLSCSNFTIVDGHGSLDQSGGALVVTNLLTLEGIRDIGPGYVYYARYTLTAGTLSASNMNVSGDLVIGDGTTNRI
ncbi:MAG TPA: C-type lectin domain-containing protein, partial [Verrucomicrobiae bacterium]|nr:C-type lectin domain-containing protein [Verrucomicrobiae bacterium]